MLKTPLLLAAAFIALGACSRDEPQPSVANASEAIEANLQARADALEQQAEAAANAELGDVMGNEDAPGATLANTGVIDGAQR